MSPGTASQPSGAAPFFIVGNDRSGTTMFRLILDRGAEAAIPTESMFLGDFAPVRRGRLDLSDRETAQRFARTVWEHPKVRLWNLPGEAPELPRGLSHEEAYRTAVEAPYLAYAAADGKSRWGDKTPYYLAHVDEILAVWPAAKFVVLVRDGRDVALSIRELPFGANNVWAAARDWAEGIRLGEQALEQHPANVLVLRYEDLVSDPEREVRQACDFLQLEYRPEMLQIERAPQDKVVSDQAGWFTNLWVGINQGSVGRWRTEMSAREQAVFTRVAGQELQRLGYEVDAGGETTVPAVRMAGYRAHHVGMRAKHFVQLRLVQERGRELRYVLGRKLRQR